MLKLFFHFIIKLIGIFLFLDIFKENDPGNKNVVSFTLEEWVEKTFYS